MSSNADVVIVGAGVAGLAAAGELAAAGLRVTILETRNRIGGRIETVIDPDSPVAVELGAEFVHGKSPALWNLLESERISTVETGGERWCDDHGKIAPCDEVTETVEELPELLEKAAGKPDRSFQQFLDECDCSPETKLWAVSYVEGFNAADRNRIGVHALLRQQRAEEQIEGDAMFRVQGGYIEVVNALRRKAANVPIRLGAAVHLVRWRAGKAEVTFQAETITAAQIVITVPVSVLPEIRFDPELLAIRDASRRMAMGHAARVTLRFREQFWDKGMSFLHSQHHAFPTWWTTLPVAAPVLTGWTGGPAAQRLSGKGEEFLTASALDTLARLVGMERGRLQEMVVRSYVHDWSADPFSLGAYSYIPAGGIDAPEIMAQPVHDTLFFAGEATEFAGHHGTVHGAIATGMRAAQQVLKKNIPM